MDLPSLAHEDPSDDAARTPVIVVPTARAGWRRPFLLALSGGRAGEVFAVWPLGRILTIGRAPDVDIRLLDDQVSRRHAHIWLAEPRSLQIRDLGSTNGTYHRGQRLRHRRLQRGDRFSLGDGNLFQVEWMDPLEERFQRQLCEAALRDGLTHAYNRRYLRQRLQTEMAFAQRHGASISLLLVDVDHFKQVNDQHGHLAGDAALRKLAQVLQSELRGEDVLSRWGGEEFAILARGTLDQPALVLGERIRRRVAATRFDHGHLRVSIGVAVYPGDGRLGEGGQGMDPVDELIEAADQALYCAKRRGRDQVVTSSEVWLEARTTRARSLILSQAGQGADMTGQPDPGAP